MGLPETLDQFKTADELGEFLENTPEALNASANCRPLLHYCQKGDSAHSFVQKLLQLGADPDLPNAKGATALQLSSIWGHGILCKALLDAGATMDVISAAALGNVSELQRIAIESPANLHELNPSTGCTPLQAAVFRNKGDAIDFLLQNGADSSIQDDEGHDSLWLAEQLGNTGLLERLKNNQQANLTTTMEASLDTKLSPKIEATAATNSGYKPF